MALALDGLWLWVAVALRQSRLTYARLLEAFGMELALIGAYGSCVALSSYGKLLWRGATGWLRRLALAGFVTGWLREVGILDR